MIEAARPASAHDVAAIAALVDQSVAELEPMRGGRIWSVREARPGPTAQALDAALADPTALVVAGTIDDVVVGYGVADLQPLRDGEQLAVVHDLYVDPGARGVGVGEAMMDLVVAWATEQRCVGIDAIALPGHRATKNFFERFGLTARAIVVHRSLRPAESQEDSP